MKRKQKNRYLVTEVPNKDGLVQVLIYDAEIEDYRAMAFDVIPKEARKIVRALKFYDSMYH